MTLAKERKIAEMRSRGLQTLTYHRNPTMAEINFGYGATHYADIDLETCVGNDGKVKKRLKSPLDGLWYSRN